MPEIQCHHCATRFRLPDEWSGKQGKCPQCGCVLDIPAKRPPVRAAPAPQRPPALPAAAAGKVPGWLDVRRLPRPWRIGIAVGAAAALLALLTFSLAPDGSPPAEDPPPDEVAQAGGHTAESPSSTDADGPQRPTSNHVPPSPQGTDPSDPPGPSDPSDPSGPRPPGETFPAPAPTPPVGDGGIVGVSTEYTDRQCRLLQVRYGILIPPAAEIIEIDGLKLPVGNPAALAAGRSPLLFLPRGSHVVRFRPREPIRISIRGDLFTEYQKMRRFFDVSGKVRSDALMERGARAADVHGTPFLLNFAGAASAAGDRWDVAGRKFRRALAVNPTFSPAHLNLAQCLLRRKLPEQAAREVELADAFNVGNVYGLARAIAEFRRRLATAPQPGQPIEAGPIEVGVDCYLSGETPSPEDRRVSALLEGISKYAVDQAQRGKILNNRAVHLADAGHGELALHHFRNALEAVKQAGPDQRYELTRTIFANMSQVCRKAGFAEADEYRQMRMEVKP